MSRGSVGGEGTRKKEGKGSYNFAVQCAMRGKVCGGEPGIRTLQIRNGTEGST